MTGLVALIAALAALTGLLVWLDSIGFDPWPWLYGTTDPRELVEAAHTYTDTEGDD